MKDIWSTTKMEKVFPLQQAEQSLSHDGGRSHVTNVRYLITFTAAGS